MRIKNFVVDDDAVSPVIGVILMVAITVILAAVIGTFVLGIGQDQQTTPQASFDFVYSNAGGDLEITHEGGDSFTTENTNELNVNTDGNIVSDFSVGSSSPVEAGDSAEVDSLGQGDETRVVWIAPGGGETQTVASSTAP